jgi:metallo-beta-lactamase class B
MAGDAAELADGGASDPWFGGDRSWRFRPVTADRIINDGDTVSLGGITLTARLGAGHTRGATTWTTTITDGGRAYSVVFPCCVGVNAGVKLTGEAALYPGVVDDYRRTFAMLESLTPDIFLPAHTETFPIGEYIEQAKTKGAAGWVDPATYRAWLAANKAAFEAALAREAR